MCIFSGQKGILIQGVEVPIPIPEVLPDGVVIGWKSWIVDVSRLKSPIQGAIWSPGSPLKANKLDSTGNSGIYAHRDEKDARGAGYSVWGEVALWGRIYSYPTGRNTGFRAEFAYPLSLFTDKTHAEGLSRTYGAKGVYINYRDPDHPEADEYGYVAYEGGNK